MWIRKFKKAHLILYLTWLLCLPEDPSVFCAALSFQTSFYNRRQQQQINKYRQYSICLNHSDGDFVEHPDNCRLFYLCKDDSQAVVASCPPTMLFNPDSKLCDKAINVRCRSTENEQILNTSTTSSTTATTAISDTNEIADAMRYCAALPTSQQDINRLTYIGSLNNCERYFICYYGQALLQECSANLHWNANIGKCDLPANADCRLQQYNNNNSFNSNNNIGSNINNGNANSSNGNVNESGSLTDQFINCPNYGQHIFPHLGRCDLFIYCVKGHATLQQCPFYYYFDIVTKSCKWRTTAVCVRDLNINFQKTAKI